jgi:formylglycine-generating enzyme required for sulfatase activity
MALIAEGPFKMGSEDGEADERPVHTVYVDAF